MRIKQKLIAILTALSLMASFLPVAMAQDFAPYTDTFIISAYYSPLPNQVKYVTGSYEKDKRLNGNGTNGADGVQVYPGMLAAPKSYAFGTKLEIPGLGVGAVHDRGGAIVEAGVRGHEHDRLDVWMGAGDEGLARALQWGIRTVTAKVYPPSHQIAESFSLPGMEPAFVADLELGDTGAEVEKLQAELKTYGYFRGNISGTFDADTTQAVLGYQLARSIVASADSAGAGIFGPQTRSNLNAEIYARTWSRSVVTVASTNSLASTTKTTTSSSANVNSRFPVTLSRGDKGDRVKDLQVALTEAGYYECEINGIYNEAMEECVFKFQKASALRSSQDEEGAGLFGAQTRAKLVTVLAEREKNASQLVAAELPTATSAPDDSGEAVQKLQAGLQRLGYYTGELSGDYNEATRLAVLQFQITAKLVAGEASLGAGFFGPKTKQAFESELKNRLVAQAELPENPEWNRPVYVAYTPVFSAQLELGDSGEAVRQLQEVLSKLEYFKGAVSGNYDAATEEAVLSFQMEHQVVSSASTPGAGYFGPNTRAKLNAVIQKENLALLKEKSPNA
jgi:peptidoglycan hydrolase-like protein with peptidoglycan-binding domain